MYSDPLSDVIFSDFIHSVKLGVSRESIVNAAKQMQSREDSALISNQGGYQSPKYTEKGSGIQTIDELAGACRSYAMMFTQRAYGMDIDSRLIGG